MPFCTFSINPIFITLRSKLALSEVYIGMKNRKGRNFIADIAKNFIVFLLVLLVTKEKNKTFVVSNGREKSLEKKIFGEKNLLGMRRNFLCIF